MDLIRTILLGIIQGLTEWLPISSTGHLKIAEHFMGETMPLAYDFSLHIGTLIVALLFFRRDIRNILSALAHLNFKTEDGKLAPLIIVGTIPAVTIGIITEGYVESTFQTLLPIATALILFGIILYASKIGKEESDNISYLAALAVGIAEGVAIIPGVSRSGMTIAVALLLGIKREKAFKFSFLLSIPAIIGAIGYTAYKESSILTSSGLDWTEMTAGVIVAMVVGYLAIRILQKILIKKKFPFFALYCWLLGITLIVLSLRGF